MSERDGESNASLSGERYILFWVGDELYATPLLDVREVVEYIEPKYVPNTLPYFSGVINIRGGIVGVVDLRKKFAQKTDRLKSTALLVCDTQQGVLSAVVDRVDSVVTIGDQELDRNPPVVTKISHHYLIGIAKIKSKLVTVIQLQQALGDDPITKNNSAQQISA